MSTKRNIYAGIFLVVATMVMMLFVPVASPHFSTNAVTPAQQVSGTFAAAAGQQNAEASLNWGGYVAYSSASSPSHSVTSVSGSWIVQTVQSSHKAVYSAQWIGIGGYFSGDSSLIQTGTSSYSGNGQTYYNCWYELLPASETALSMQINAGDIMNSHIFLASGSYGATQTWNIYLNDTTTGGHTFEQVNYNSSMLSAEWIDERPMVGNSLSNLANFGTAYYGQSYTGISGTCAAVIGGVSGSISAFAYTSMTMVNNSNVAIATPGALTDAGTSFTMTYSSGGHGGHGK